MLTAGLGRPFASTTKAIGGIWSIAAGRVLRMEEMRDVR